METRHTRTMVVHTVSTRPTNSRRVRVVRKDLAPKYAVSYTLSTALAENTTNSANTIKTPAPQRRESRLPKPPHPPRQKASPRTPATRQILSGGTATVEAASLKTLCEHPALDKPNFDGTGNTTDKAMEEALRQGNEQSVEDESPKTAQKDATTAIVSPEENAYLNEQLEKRKEQKTKAARSSNRQKKLPKPKKRTRSKSVPPAKKTAMKDTFRAYMVEISRDKLLGQAETISLANKIRDGMVLERTLLEMGRELGRRPSVPELAKRVNLSIREVQRRRMEGTAAKNDLVAANLRLVTSVASKLDKSRSLSTPGITLDDMVQEGSFGLIRAAEKFDASRGFKFSTYATWWIRAYVMRSLTMQGRCIKVPSSVVDEYIRIRKAIRTLRDGEKKPTDEQVANKLGITPAKLRFVVNVATQVPTSLDVPLDMPDGNSRSFGDLVEGDCQIEERLVHEMKRKELDTAMRKYLRPIERAVVRLRFGLEDEQPRTFRETGELLNLSKERIRQIVFRALQKLRTPEIQEMLVEATTR